ncbi:DUF1376 domain-containing protein [Kaistia algarum]|uniref:DUF1376 domain-containing protein n=1 Tax=Kaistia algarum TaxID=2083279 RepID=UPI001A9C4AB6|nr:DUF1376 domain-containing protein [Kaistia algarum]MCX5516215.1 DUF1376 domain-containing protein [Kaistia algarum]
MSIEGLPAPLTPSDCDLRGMPYMPVDIVRLFDSDLYALATGDEFKAAFSLWGRSFLQVPAASIPDDDRILAHLSGAGTRWKKVRDMVLRGWIKCSDGRLYHPVVAEKALDAWDARSSQRARTEAARAARAAQRQTGAAQRNNVSDRGQTDDVTTSVTELVTGSKGEGELSKEEETSLRSVGAPQSRSDQKTPEKPKSKTGTRIAPDWSANTDDREFARTLGFGDVGIDRECGRFRDYWIAKPGRDGVKLDWSATFRNWFRRAAEQAGIAPIAEVIQLPTQEDRTRWQARISWARRHKSWSRAWGPLPSQPGCRAPPDLLKPDDGAGWAEADEAEMRREAQ